MKPSADDVARAIIAACVETGEDPEAVIGGNLGLRARHYALHALIHCFQGINRHDACRLVGAPGKPAAFWNASWHQIVRPRGSGFGHIANWFDDAVYGRVIAAVQAGPDFELTLRNAYRDRASNEGEKTDIRLPAKRGPPFGRQSPIVRQALAPERRVSRVAIGAPSLKPGSRDLTAMLAEAARNTAAKTPPPED